MKKQWLYYPGFALLLGVMSCCGSCKKKDRVSEPPSPLGEQAQPVVEEKAKAKPCVEGSILSFALRVVESISRPGMEKETNLTWKATKLADIAKAYARAGKYDTALKVVGAQPEQMRPDALAAITLAYIEAGKHDEAQKTADMIAGIKDWKSPPALAGIVAAWLEAGQYDKALALVEKIEAGKGRTGALVDIANQYTKLGRKSDVPEILARALEAAKKIESSTYHTQAHPGSDMWEWVYDSSPRLAMLVEIARAFSNAGYHDKAVEVAGLVTDYAQEHFGKSALPEWEAKIFLMIAEGQSEEDKKEKTLELLSKALEATKSIQAVKIGDSDEKINLFISLAGRFSKLGKKDKSLELLSFALKEAELIDAVDEPTIRVSIGCNAMARIASKYVELGDSDKASGIVSKALKIVQTTKLAKSAGSSKDKVEALALLAAVYAQMDQEDKAEKLFSKAAKTAGKMKDACWKAQAHLDVVNVHIGNGRYDQAIEGAKTMESFMKQGEISGASGCWVGSGEGFEKIIDVLFEDSKLDKIIEVTGMMQPSWNKVEVLTRLANAFAQQGKKDKAAKTILGVLDVVKEKQDGWERQFLHIANEYSASCEKPDKAMKNVLQEIIKGIR